MSHANWWLFLVLSAVGCGAVSRSPAGDASDGPGGGGSTDGEQAAAGAGASASGESSLVGGAGESSMVGGAGAGSEDGCSVANDPSFGLKLTGAGRPYEGEAIVERSTIGELILDYVVPASPGFTETEYHATISAARELPILPPGAKVWLAETVEAATPSGLGPSYSRVAFSVRGKPGGQLLLASGSDVLPVDHGPFIDDCAEPVCRGSSAQLIHGSVEISVDPAVTLADGQTIDLELGGAHYDVHGNISRIPTDWSCGGETQPPRDMRYFEIWRRDPAPLIAGLKLGAPPACGQGNSPAVKASMGLYAGPGNSSFHHADPFSGPVVYRGIGSAILPNAFRFEVPGLVASGQERVVLLLDTTEGTFVPPPALTELWLEDDHTLRESQNGALLFSSMGFQQPLDSATEVTLAKALGVSAYAVRRCWYDITDTNALEALWDVEIDTDPPTLAKSGERTTLTLGGKKYEVWVDGVRILGVVVYAVP